MLRFFVRYRSRASSCGLALVAIPNLRINKTQQCIVVGIKRERRMQQQPTCSTAFADRPISIGFRTPPAKDQFAGILDHDDLATGNT